MKWLKLLKKLLSKKRKKLYNDKEIIKTPTIPKPKLTDMTAVNYFLNKSGGVNRKAPNQEENDENKRQNFKKLVKQEQLKVLFNYIKSKTKGGLYKKEGNRIIGEYFNVGKDLIGRLLKTLEDSEYIGRLNDLDKYYKLLKEEFTCIK